jgi:hypothetical protein
MKTFVLSAALAFVAACSSDQLASDSKSNWLRQCVTRSDCASGLSCVCGICTKACNSTPACNGQSNVHAMCVNPIAADLSAMCQSEPAAGPLVCLQPCSPSIECGAKQRCSHGLCVSALDADGGGPGSSGISGGSSPAVFDAGVTSATDAGPDGGTCDCNAGLVCNVVDRTCVEPGVLDSQGVATLTDPLPQNADVYAADADFIYGVQFGTTNSTWSIGRLMRWPTSGGEGEALAQGQTFDFGSRDRAGSVPASTQPPLVIDADHIYFVAAADATELSFSLWSMPKDDSKAPVRHGSAGSVIAQDKDYLYFSNDGDSRVLRMGKSTLDKSDQREQLYVSASDAPQTIVLIAVNASSVFVTELPPKATDRTTFTVRRIDKASANPTVFGTSDRFTALPNITFADDSYFVLVGYQDADRVDLSTLEVKLLGGLPTMASFADGALYAGSEDGGMWVVNLATARRTELIPRQRQLYVRSIAAVPGAVFVSVAPISESIGSLLHIVPPK